MARRAWSEFQRAVLPPLGELSDGYKWLRRWREQGAEELAEESRRPGTCPYRTAEELEHSVRGDNLV